MLIFGLCLFLLVLGVMGLIGEIERERSAERAYRQLTKWRLHMNDSQRST